LEHQTLHRPGQRPLGASDQFAVSANKCTNQTLDEGMRAQRVEHAFDLFVQDAQVRLPAVELEQSIMI
jgi:hypothetical protein